MMMFRSIMAIVAILIALAGTIIVIGYRNARATPLVRDAVIKLTDWPSDASPITIALVADIHLESASMGPQRLLRIVAQLNALHGAVAESVFLHHTLGMLKLPTKNDVLDWSLGEAVQPLHARTGADYALFFWIRDSYASAERKAAMVAMALFGVGIPGGSQIGYASLVDLRDGRVVWFNVLRRASGDLREAKPAEETLEALLKSFPAAR